MIPRELATDHGIGLVENMVVTFCSRLSAKSSALRPGKTVTEGPELTIKSLLSRDYVIILHERLMFPRA